MARSARREKQDAIKAAYASNGHDRSHLKKLLAAMGNKPHLWVYRGECYDSGAYGASHCACGHPIRFEFPMYREMRGGKEKRIIIGSTCIETAPFLPKELVDAYWQKIEEMKAEEKARLEAERAVKLEVLLGTLNKLAENMKPFMDYANVRSWNNEQGTVTAGAHYDAKRFTGSLKWDLSKVSKLKTTCGKLRNVAALIDRYGKVMNAIEAANDELVKQDEETKQAKASNE